MDQTNKDKSMLYRLWASTTGKEIENLDEQDRDLSQAMETLLTGTDETPVMDLEYNYLDALRRDLAPVDIKPNEKVPFTDFIVERQTLEPGSKEFLLELHDLAHQIFEERQMLSAEESISARICVKVSEDKMSAWIFIFPPEHEGKDVTEDLIWEALNQCHVFYGISEPDVNRIVRKKEYLKAIKIASGTPPKEGREGSVKDHYPRNERDTQDFDNLDLSQVDWLHPIGPGDIICDIKFPVGSTPGRNVAGDILEGRDIPPLDLPMGSNVILNDSRTALVSKIKGTLYYRHGRFEVKNVVNILSDVNSATGNIDTIGNLEILGDVVSGYSVQATGNITVRGMVGNSTMIAGGDIMIDMGIKGNGGALLRAGGNINCRYMENCMAKAKGKIVSGSIINCEAVSNQTVEAKTIVGGSITALHRIVADTIGNAQRRQTICYLGLTQETLQEKIILEDRIQELEDAVRQQVKNIRLLKSQKGQNEEREEQVLQLTMLNEQYKIEIRECKEELYQLEQVIRDESQCELQAGRVYPPVKVIIRSDSLMIDREQSMCRVWSDNGEIRML